MAGRCCKDVNVNIGDECLGLGRSTVKKPQRSFLDESSEVVWSMSVSHCWVHKGTTSHEGRGVRTVKILCMDFLEHGAPFTRSFWSRVFMGRPVELSLLLTGTV